MVDANQLLRTWLVATPTVKNLLGAHAADGIYCGDLPAKLDITLGPAIQIIGVGSRPHTEIPEIVDERKQVRVWANTGEFHKAREVYRAIYDLLHGAANVNIETAGYVMRCQEVTGGQDITDPDTGWVTVVAFFHVMAHPIS